MAVGESSRKAIRAICATVAAVMAVLVFKWVVQAAALHSAQAERTVPLQAVPIEERPMVMSLAAMIPEDLETNLAGLSLKKRRVRMGMAYSLAVDVAEERAKAAGWERVDDVNSLAFKVLSGSESMYRTPSGSMVYRKITPLVGADSLCTDIEIPVEQVTGATETTTPDELANRSGLQVISKMPAQIGGVIVGSPLFTELIRRGRGAALIAHSVVALPPSAVDHQIAERARASGWTKAVGVERAWILDNLVFRYSVSLRPDGTLCDVDYRFSDDESGFYTKGKHDEN